MATVPRLALSPAVTYDEEGNPTTVWPVAEDYGLCVDSYSGVRPWSATSRSHPAWSVARVYCTAHYDGGQPVTGTFLAVFRSGVPVERIVKSAFADTARCTVGGMLGKMPLKARLELDVCAVPDAKLSHLSR